jgi:DNA-binding XRE family transcriptional regulator
MLNNTLREVRMRDYMLNMKDFAAFLGVAEPQYNRYENSVSTPSLEIALKISQKVNRSVNDIWSLRDK